MLKNDVRLYGDPCLDGNKNIFISEAAFFYIKSAEKFSGSMFD